MKEFDRDHYRQVAAGGKTRLLAVTTFHQLYGKVPENVRLNVQQAITSRWYVMLK